MAGRDAVGGCPGPSCVPLVAATGTQGSRGSQAPAGFGASPCQVRPGGAARPQFLASAPLSAGGTGIAAFHSRRAGLGDSVLKPPLYSSAPAPWGSEGASLGRSWSVGEAALPVAVAAVAWLEAWRLSVCISQLGCAGPVSTQPRGLLPPSLHPLDPELPEVPRGRRNAQLMRPGADPAQPSLCPTVVYASSGH